MLCKYFEILFSDECRGTISANEQGLALLGHLKIVRPELKPN
jgi:hypothetical protein